MSKALKYTLDTVEQVLATLSGVAPGVLAATVEAKTAREHAGAVKEAAYRIIAQAGAQLWLIGHGPKTLKVMLERAVPDKDKRRAVTRSEVWKVLEKHPEAKALSKAWASGDFESFPYRDAVKEVAGEPDSRKALRKAVEKAAEKMPLQDVAAVVHEVLTARAAQVEAVTEVQAEVSKAA